jgi:hypothetical protein
LGLQEAAHPKPTERSGAGEHGGAATASFVPPREKNADALTGMVMDGTVCGFLGAFAKYPCQPRNGALGRSRTLRSAEAG